MLPEHLTATVKDLLFLLGDLGRMHLVLTGQLTERLLFFQRFERDRKCELDAPALWLFRHDLLHITIRSIQTVLYFACGPVSGTNDKCPTLLDEIICIFVYSDKYAYYPPEKWVVVIVSMLRVAPRR